MQPVAHELLSRYAFALRDLRFVMREDVIDAAAVDVDLIAEQRHGHRTALDMPAGTTRSPGRVPFHVAVCFVPSFPQCKIADVFLIVFVMLHAACRLQPCEIEVRELSIIWKFVDAKVN